MMISSIQHIDEVILRAIHVNGQNQVFDVLMPWLRNPYFWAPFYLFLLVWMWQQFGRRGLWWCLFFFVTFTFCDFVSASLIKPWVHRLRPCQDENLSFILRELVTCGSGYSFPSSHAANHTGLAVFMILTLGHQFRWVKPVAILWALGVCYAQMYVGVHYPSDILGGAFIGAIIAFLISRYMAFRFGFGKASH
ncbi:MAG: phosphatase PAP2 family protein [Chitinophagaceae bacterium]|nr:phosphatase PAP2 family protein [Chitinophagaceae bacterium]